VAAIFPLAISGLGKFTKISSALLVMGIAGGILFTLLFTTLKDKDFFLMNSSFVFMCFPAICTFFIMP
jgi:MFS transporter, FHS family, L-fucose permease